MIKAIFEWMAQNSSIVKMIISLMLSIGAWIYATIIHKKSSSKIETLKVQKEIEQELLKQIEDLQKALNERSQK